MDVAELIEASRAGDADAFTELVRRYQGMVFGYAFATLGDFHLAEDAAQLAFVTAYRRLDALEHPERFGGWLRGIVRFECSHLRRARRVEQVPIEVAAGLAAPAPGPVQVAEEREALDRIHAAIDALPPAERDVTVLFYLQDHSQREIAAFLNVSVDTINNRLRAARTRLKAGGLLPMARNALKQHDLPEDFAARIGEVIRAHGPIVEARFAPDRRPPVLNAVTIGGANGEGVTAEVAQHLGDGLVRCIPLPASDRELRPGLRVVDTAAPIRVPLDGETVARVMTSIRRSADARGMAETGIKAIDVLCPLPVAGVVGLLGDMRTGKMVVVEELIQRLAGSPVALSILVFVDAAAEVTVVQGLDYRTSAAVEAIYLPVADTGAAALEEPLARLDAAITLSRRLAQNGLYPAIDPLRSTSRLLDPAIVGQELYDVALGVRRLLEQAARLNDDDLSAAAETVRRRAARLRRFLTQPFFVAEEFTNRSGRFVSRKETVAGCKALLEGRYDELPEEALHMIGDLDEAVAGA